MAEDKVVFPTDVGAETMWAERLSDGNYKLNNTPVLVDGISHSDIFRAKSVDGDDRPYFDCVVVRGPYFTYRVVAQENRPAGSDAKLKDMFSKLRAVAFDWTRFSDDGAAYFIDKGVDTGDLDAELDRGEDEGIWDWCVTSPPEV